MDRSSAQPVKPRTYRVLSLDFGSVNLGVWNGELTVVNDRCSFRTQYWTRLTMIHKTVGSDGKKIPKDLLLGLILPLFNSYIVWAARNLAFEYVVMEVQPGFNVLTKAMYSVVSGLITSLKSETHMCPARPQQKMLWCVATGVRPDRTYSDARYMNKVWATMAVSHIMSEHKAADACERYWMMHRNKMKKKDDMDDAFANAIAYFSPSCQSASASAASADALQLCLADLTTSEQEWLREWSAFQRATASTATSVTAVPRVKTEKDDAKAKTAVIMKGQDDSPSSSASPSAVRPKTEIPGCVVGSKRKTATTDHTTVASTALKQQLKSIQRTCVKKRPRKKVRVVVSIDESDVAVPD